MFYYHFVYIVVITICYTTNVIHLLQGTYIDFHHTCKGFFLHISTHDLGVQTGKVDHMAVNIGWFLVLVLP